MRRVLKEMSNNTKCPNCKSDLKDHSNEQLQQCAFNELSKINRKVGVTID